MALYVLGDLHLPFGQNKPMDIFGGRWIGYLDKLEKGLSVLTNADTLVIPGDLCWAMSLEQAKLDFEFLRRFPGRKILLKGNHDYWWTTASKFQKMCQENQWDDLFMLHNNCFFYEDIAICGTRGWFFEEEKGGTHDEKVFRRELIRLETSLKAAGDTPKLCFLHYPPRYRGYNCPEIIALLEKYQVRSCYYGHLHGDSHKLAIEGNFNSVSYSLVAADYVNFSPVFIQK